MSKFESSPVNSEFQKQIKVFLPDRSVKIVAGVSGGPDSMALLYLMHRHKLNVVAVHCNYQLRGKASDLDQKLVEEICALWNIECVAVTFDPEESQGMNFQAWARDRRYQVYRDVKKEFEADLIATAHHEDDQIETIFQKILRGAGVSAWKGMDVLDGDLFRPLLGLSRAQIMQFIQEYHTPYRIDRSNEESTYARNFIRNNWFPLLNDLFPGWETNLLEIPKRADEFRKMAKTILAGMSDHPKRINRKEFLKLDPAIWPVVFKQFIRQTGADIDLSRGFLEDIGRLKALQSGQTIEISSRYTIIRDRDQFKLTESGGDDSISVQIDENDIESGFVHNCLQFQAEEAPGSFSENVLHLDLSKIQFPLTLRTWEDGDVIRPFGMEGTQLISDHLTNRKISSDQKKSAKVLQFFDGTICAVIFPGCEKIGRIGTISELVRCTQKTKKTLTIRKV